MNEQTPAQALRHQMGITEEDIGRRQRFVDLTSVDVERIAGIREPVVRNAEELARGFFDYLAKFEEARPLFASRTLLERARQLKREHLIALVGGDYGVAYVEQRLELGLLYSKVGLDPRVFLGAFHFLMRNVGAAVMKHGERRPLEAFESFLSLNKVGFIDIGLITDVLVAERERTIQQQQEAIRELSTPVLQIRERLLLLPIIGLVDTHRARLITENLLQAVRATRAKVIVMDVTGVATIDSKVANHLLQTVSAARLMGARVIVSGISADVAQSLVSLGIELARLNTVGDLQGGLEEAERLIGYQVALQPGAAAAPAETEQPCTSPSCGRGGS